MPYEEDALAVKNYAACMDIATFPISQDPRQKDLVGGEKGKGRKIALAEGLLSLVVYPDVAIVMVKYCQLVDHAFSHRA